MKDISWSKNISNGLIRNSKECGMVLTMSKMMKSSRSKVANGKDGMKKES